VPSVLSSNEDHRIEILALRVDEHLCAATVWVTMLMAELVAVRRRGLGIPGSDDKSLHLGHDLDLSLGHDDTIGCLGGGDDGRSGGGLSGLLDDASAADLNIVSVAASGGAAA